jgi:hypothetical protein
MYSLLNDPNLVLDSASLDVNPANPFGKYKSEGDYLSTMNSGAWYQQAYENLVKDPEKDFVLPICCMVMKQNKKGRVKQAVGYFQLLYLTKSFATSPPLGPLGYIYDVNIVDSKQEQAHQSNDYNGKHLHAIFHTVLETFIHVHNLGLLDNITLTLGSQQQVINLSIPSVFIIGDMKGGDKMCRSLAGYSNKMARLCRKCNVKGEESGDPFVQCS